MGAENPDPPSEPIDEPAEPVLEHDDFFVPPPPEASETDTEPRQPLYTSAEGWEASDIQPDGMRVIKRPMAGAPSGYEVKRVPDNEFIAEPVAGPPIEIEPQPPAPVVEPGQAQVEPEVPQDKWVRDPQLSDSGMVVIRRGNKSRFISPETYEAMREEIAPTEPEQAAAQPGPMGYTTSGKPIYEILGSELGPGGDQYVRIKTATSGRLENGEPDYSEIEFGEMHVPVDDVPEELLPGVPAAETPAETEPAPTGPELIPTGPEAPPAAGEMADTPASLEELTKRAYNLYTISRLNNEINEAIGMLGRELSKQEIENIQRYELARYLKDQGAQVDNLGRLTAEGQQILDGMAALLRVPPDVLDKTVDQGREAPPQEDPYARLPDEDDLNYLLRTTRMSNLERLEAAKNSRSARVRRTLKSSSSIFRRAKEQANGDNKGPAQPFHEFWWDAKKRYNSYSTEKKIVVAGIGGVLLLNIVGLAGATVIKSGLTVETLRKKRYDSKLAKQKEERMEQERARIAQAAPASP
jgi:hypothetical protein